jgi:hypothetical protein
MRFNRRFWETCRLHRQSRRISQAKNQHEAGRKQICRSVHVPPKRQSTSNGLHGVTPQKIELIVTTALRLNSYECYDDFQVPSCYCMLLMRPVQFKLTPFVWRPTNKSVFISCVKYPHHHQHPGLNSRAVSVKGIELLRCPQYRLPFGLHHSGFGIWFSGILRKFSRPVVLNKVWPRDLFCLPL